MYARIWYEPDGVKITTFASGSALTDQLTACATLRSDGRVHEAATFEDVETALDLRMLLPSDRLARSKWRKNPGGRGVIVDLTVPDPPLPNQAARDAIAAATTLVQLKTAVLQAL